MALLYEALHPRVANFLVRHFGLRQPVRTQIAPDVQPIVDVNEFFQYRPDLGFEQGWRSFASAVFQAAGGAGNFSAVGLAIPAGRAVVAFGFILVVNKAVAELANYAVLTNTALATVLAAISPISQLDARQDVTGFVSQLQQATATGAAVAGGPKFLPAGPFATATPQLWVPFVLNAGHQVLVIDPTANEAMTATFIWWERDAFPVTE